MLAILQAAINGVTPAQSVSFTTSNISSKKYETISKLEPNLQAKFNGDLPNLSLRIELKPVNCQRN